MASTAIASPEYVAKELIEKFCGDSVPVPKHLNILEICATEWNHSAYRFQNLIFTYGTLYRDMLFSIQKKQNILQVKLRQVFLKKMKSFLNIQKYM